MPLRTFTDQLGAAITLEYPPQRIISLVPSQTELLAYLELESRVVGITKFCIHPFLWKKSKTIIGGTKNFNFPAIASLKPDLIIGNKEENYQDGIEALKSICPVWMSDIVTLSDAFNMIQQAGQLTDTTIAAENLVHRLQHSFSLIEKLPRIQTLYLIWHKPWIAVAANTFIHELIEASGLQNCLEKDLRYPEVSESRMRESNPELVLLSSEPFPFAQKHIDEIKNILPDAKIVLVDGELFSWYGSRMLFFPEYVSSLRESLQ